MRAFDPRLFVTCAYVRPGAFLIGTNASVAERSACESSVSLQHPCKTEEIGSGAAELDASTKTAPVAQIEAWSSAATGLRA